MHTYALKFTQVKNSLKTRSYFSHKSHCHCYISTAYPVNYSVICVMYPNYSYIWNPVNSLFFKSISFYVFFLFFYLGCLSMKMGREWKRNNPNNLNSIWDQVAFLCFPSPQLSFSLLESIFNLNIRFGSHHHHPISREMSTYAFIHTYLFIAFLSSSIPYACLLLFTFTFFQVMESRLESRLLPSVVHFVYSTYLYSSYQSLVRKCRILHSLPLREKSNHIQKFALLNQENQKLEQQW